VNSAERQQQIAETMTERELEDVICELLDTFGIWYHHDRPARTGRVAGGKEVWRNHFRGQNGVPDFDPILGNGRIIYAELKTQKGRLSPEQTEWLHRLKAAGAEVYVWRPIDWLNGTIAETLMELR
jgi:hypothetical protein